MEFGTDHVRHQCRTMSLHAMKSKRLIVIYTMRGVTVQWEGKMKDLGGNEDDGAEQSFGDSVMSFGAKSVLNR